MNMISFFFSFFLTMVFALTFHFSIYVLDEEFYDLGLILFVLSITFLRTAFDVAEMLDSRNL